MINTLLHYLKKDPNIHRNHHFNDHSKRSILECKILMTKYLEITLDERAF